MKKILLSLSTFALVLSAVPSAQASLYTYTQLCPKSNPTDGAFTFCQHSTRSDQLNVSYPGLNPGDPDQVFSGSVSATATDTTYKFNLNLAVQDYLQSNYVYSTETNPNTGLPQLYTASTAAASVSLTDNITVSGGTGVYSLNYILGIDGTLTANGAVNTQFCAQVALPQGTGTLTSSCYSSGQTIPSTITLSYADLLFGGPVVPTLYIGLYGSVNSIFEESLPTLGNNLINGSGTGQFGNTIKLLKLTVTDASGNLIPGLTLKSSNGIQYPTDPSNLAQNDSTTAVPEPLTILGGMTALGLGRVLKRKVKKNG